MGYSFIQILWPNLYVVEEIFSKNERHSFKHTLILSSIIEDYQSIRGTSSNFFFFRKPYLRYFTSFRVVVISHIVYITLVGFSGDGE